MLLLSHIHAIHSHRYSLFFQLCKLPTQCPNFPFFFICLLSPSLFHMYGVYLFNVQSYRVFSPFFLLGEDENYMTINILFLGGYGDVFFCFCLFILCLYLYTTHIVVLYRIVLHVAMCIIVCTLNLPTWNIRYM